VSPARSKVSERGVALVAVLWVVAVLSMLATIFGAETRTDANLARNLADNAQAEALADAGVYWVIALLLYPEPSYHPRADGTSYQWSFAGGQVFISIQDEGGKIDLNLAPDDLWQALFLAAGASPDSAAELVDKIRDFCDRDHVRRPRGAEDRDYHLAGADHDAKDAPFDSVAELEQVLGITHELFVRLEPLLTVYSGTRGVNPLTASRDVLQLLPKIAAQRDAMLQERRGFSNGLATSQSGKMVGSGASGSLLNVLQSAGQQLATPSGAVSASMDLDPGVLDSSALRAVTIIAEARTSAGGIFRRKAVVLFAQGPFAQGPFAIREWQRNWQ
jgi:general secretion pathway protein K